MARGLALAAAVAVSLLAVSGAGGAGAQAPKRGGTVVYGGPFAEPACFSFRLECAPGTSQLALLVVQGKVLEDAFDVGPDLTWRPRLVSRAEFTRRPPFTVTYHIDPEAIWSDGVPVTARDFVFTVRETRRLADSEDHWFRTKLRTIRAVDARTVKLVLRSRFAHWREFGTVFPAHALEGEDLTTVWRDRIDNPKTGAPIGNGPFLVERWERGKQIVLRRNPRYWGPHPAYLDRIVFRFNVQGPALRDEFRAGALDAASHFPPGVVAELRQEPGVRVLSHVAGNGWDHLEIRDGPGGHPALGSKLVRRAIAYGIDRVAIVRRFLRETNPNAQQRDSALYPNQSPHYRPNWNRYRYRPAESRRLLEQVGCRRGADGIYVCAGRRLQLRFVTTFIQGGFRPEVLELAKTQLRQAGIEAVTSVAPGGTLFGQILPGGNFDVALFSWISTPGATSKSIFGCGAFQNWTGYCQRLVTADLDQAERILDPERQERVLNRADVQISKDVPVLPLYQQPQSVAVRSSVRNFGLAANTQLSPLWNAENWWLAE